MEGSPRQRAAALAAMLVLLGGLGLRLWASGEGKFLLGPNHLATDGETLFAHVDGELIEITVRDGVTRRTALGPLGIRDGLADLQVLPDGSLLLGDRAGDRMLRCDLAAPKCEAFGPPPGTVDEYFKFHHDAANGITYLTDSLAHRSRLLVHDGDGVRVADGDFLFPNAVHLGSDGLLRIADTNHHRLAAYRPGPVPEALPASDLTTRLAPGTDHVWPIAFTETGPGDLWVLVGGEELRGARLAHYTTRQPLRQLEFPTGRAPSGLVPFDGGIVVADAEALVFYRVDPATLDYMEWGPPDLLAEFDAKYAARGRYAALATIGGVLVGAGALLMLAVAVWIRRTTPAGATGPVHPVPSSLAQVSSAAGVRWLVRPASVQKTIENLRAIAWLDSASLLVLLPGTVLFALAISPYVGIDPRLFQLSAMWAVLLVGLAWVRARELAGLRCRVGVDGRGLHLEDGASVTSLPWSEVWHSPTRLLARDRVVPIGRSDHLLFESEGVAGVLRPALDARLAISELQLSVRALRAGDPGLRSKAVLAAVVLVYLSS